MAERKPIPQGLKLALDFGPLVVFFAAFFLLRDHPVTLGGETYGGFVLATAVFVPVLIASMAVLWRLSGHLAPMQVATLVLVTVFGGLSVWFNDPRFFKMKPTLIYLLFAALLGFGLIRGKPWLQLVMDGAIPMRAEGWVILTRRLVAFFLFLAIANEVIWRNFSDATWVNFKTFGLTILLMGFFVAQSRLFARFAPEEGGKSES
ncbi:inner membrane-spanning protein YciB [Rhodobacter capsulatus]|jgi:intracellular septation protein|uniref:Inner membrane-spanning protein YciB n=1 Tax=Rhodobacter capsulatus (strain ATCC BAA-309 / NBRC 16581 / SB1003) TaxID=272942 RepID=D5ALQ7_RHOCB|nr:inner membrane-spanning protein YciB [Rhodobacter capsulatus]ADE86118.1 intracellular septation protein A [Rhodobacter capsulatus SB 1003]ETD01198.1 intracellular septation protein [Rhodobacter capsulatus DE442]ETD75782.1 intracellular septation protein [Rhodobacter capsulatus R121]ETD87728.1 intracellular septation protein [Rhodobacter capsulatus YW2]ETE53063.1 intracellular septation protein [Rhodobacter capsulatus Y262]